MGVVFAKTAKGQDEITSKSGGLSPRIRRVLIFIDGKRSVSDLHSVLPEEGLNAILDRLQDEGYIVPSGSPGAAPAPLTTKPSATTSKNGGAAENTLFTPLPEGGDPIRLQQARNFMLNTIRTFVGMVGTSSLLERIENARDHDALRALFADWEYAIATSGEGRRDAPNLRERLLKVL